MRASCRHRYSVGLVHEELTVHLTLSTYTIPKIGRCIQSVRYTPKDTVAAAADSTGVSSDNGGGNPQEGDGGEGSGGSKPFKLPPKRRGRSFLRCVGVG